MTGKYASLEKYLAGLQTSMQEVTMTFEQIERILNDRLPASASRHKEWWHNESEGSHVQAHAWMNAGWLVDSVDQRNGWVRFQREE